VIDPGDNESELPAPKLGGIEGVVPPPDGRFSPTPAA
jgi:hypothetical protein